VVVTVTSWGAGTRRRARVVEVEGDRPRARPASRRAHQARDGGLIVERCAATVEVPGIGEAVKLLGVAFPDS
jgi:hypothetical protein